MGPRWRNQDGHCTVGRGLSEAVLDVGVEDGTGCTRLLDINEATGLEVPS